MRRNQKFWLIVLFVLAFAFSLGLTLAEEASACPDPCCEFQEPGCGVSYGRTIFIPPFTFICDCTYVESTCCQIGCGSCA